MTWLKKWGSPKHEHRYFVDADTGDAVCLCGKLQGKRTKDTPNKFNASKTEYNGVIYHSGKEAQRAAELCLLLLGKAIRTWNRQVKISFDICSRCLRLCSGICSRHTGDKVHHLSNYYIDFVVQENDGTHTYEEVKGMETAEWKAKWRLLEILYGDDETKKLVVIK